MLILPFKWVYHFLPRVMENIADRFIYSHVSAFTWRKVRFRRYLFVSFAVICRIHEITIQLCVSANKARYAPWWTSGKKNFGEIEKEKFLFYILTFQAGLNNFLFKVEVLSFSFFIEINYELIEKLLSHVRLREKAIKKYWNIEMLSIFRLLTRFGGTTLASFWNSATRSSSSCVRRIISWASSTFTIIPPCSHCGGSVSNGYQADLVSIWHIFLSININLL